MRVVASYTTLPSRYSVLLKSITSLRHQSYPVDAIYLALPNKARRLNKEYPPLTPELAAVCTVVPVPTDYGPITKIYGALVSEQDPNTIIISCDDDVEFPFNFVEALVTKHKKHPNTCICGTGALIGRGLPLISIISTVEPFPSWNNLIGFEIPEEGRNVDLVFGVGGVLYLRKFFPTVSQLEEEIFRYSLIDNAIFHNDDVLISGYLSKHNIPRKVFANMPPIKHLNGEDALSGDIMKMIIRLDESIKKAQSHGFFLSFESVSVEETPAGRIFITIMVIIGLIIGIILLYPQLPTTSSSRTQ